MTNNDIRAVLTSLRTRVLDAIVPTVIGSVAPGGSAVSVSGAFVVDNVTVHEGDQTGKVADGPNAFLWRIRDNVLHGWARNNAT